MNELTVIDKLLADFAEYIYKDIESDISNQGRVEDND